MRQKVHTLYDQTNPTKVKVSILWEIFEFVQRRNAIRIVGLLNFIRAVQNHESMYERRPDG